MSQRAQTSLIAFNGGEVGELLDMRTDLAKYVSSCRQMHNMRALPYGAARRRRGFRFMGEVKNHAQKVRLVGLNISTTDRFVLEFGNLYIRFYTTTGQVLLSGSPYEIATPYPTADLFGLQFLQINDVTYIVHPNHAPRRLSRFGLTNWTLEQVTFTGGPFLDENVTATTLSSSGTSGTVTLTASAALFEPGHVGSLWKLTHTRPAGSVTIDITANGTSSTLLVLGTWTLYTYNIWHADVVLQRSLDGGTTWDNVGRFVGRNDRNVAQSGTQETQSALFRIKVENWVVSPDPGSTAARAVLECPMQDIEGIVQITAVGSGGTTATATVIKELESTAVTKLWNEGAWSQRRGFPRTTALHEQRLWFGGTKHQPATLWFSVTGDLQNFAAGDADDTAGSFTLASTEANELQWLSARRVLIVGTSGGEWAVSGGDSEVITPSRVLAKAQTNTGSDYRRAFGVNDTLLFLQRGGQKVREFAYTIERDGYTTPDLTRLAYHILADGAVDAAYQQQQDSVFWVVTQGGLLLGMAYERAEDVVSWSRMTTDGAFEAVATIYGEAGLDDELWVVVNRTVGGETKRFVERLDTVERVAVEDAFYVDCGLSYAGVPVTAVTGLAHLEGKAVQVLADGYDVGTHVVNSGQIALALPASKVHVGLAFESILEPMFIAFDPSMGPIGLGRAKRILEASVRLLGTVGCEISTDGTAWREIPFRTPQNLMDRALPVFSGSKTVSLSTSYLDEVRIILRQRLPLPFTVQALIVKWELTGN